MTSIEKGAKIQESNEATTVPLPVGEVASSPSLNLDDQYSKFDDDDDDDVTILSNMLMTCLLFIVHSLTNALLLSGWNPTRCLFW
jgi:hypothetical protein